VQIEKKMGKNKLAPKLGVGFVLFVMVMSVFSGAISATDIDTNSIDSGINASLVVHNAGFNDGKDPKSLSYTTSQTRVGALSYSSESDFLKIKFGEMFSGSTYALDWTYQYDLVGHPGEFIHSIYKELYAVAANNWDGVKWSTNFNIDTYFGSEAAPDTATLHYGDLKLTRQVNSPEGGAKSFSITYVLTNTGDSTLKNVLFFQGVDYDIYDSVNDYAWYTEATDSVWQNDDNYFKNGFHGSRTSSHHDCNYYTSMWDDISRAQLNNQTKYPESGAADCGIALQWDAGDLLPQASWDLTITFYFGEAAGIEANAGPDQLVGRDQPVTFDASGSSSVSNITTYEWDFDNDGIFDVSVSTPIYVYEAGCTELGEYIVALRVTDDADRNDMDTVKITVVPNVDLIVSNISFTPTKILDGDIVIFNATVENIGREALTEDFYVGFEIDGTYIGQKRISGGLLTGSSIHVLHRWGANAGAHNVSVYADRGYYSSENNLIPESNETNNVLSQALPEILFPELAVTHLIWSPTEIINDGDVVTFTATVENIGAGNTTSDFYVGFEIDGVHIGSRPITGLVAGGSINVSQSWDADAGNHAVKVIVDYDGEITESDESNNELSQTLPKIPFPDLTVTDISWSPQTDIRHGDAVTFTATVENIGVGNTSSNFYVLFEIDDTYMGHRKVSGGVAAGGSIGVNLNWIAFEGNHTVKAIVDEYDTITESNESNNEQSEVLPEIPQPPQVNVTSPNGGDIWYGARDITWEATSPEGLDLTIKLELYNGYSYKLIADGLFNTGVYQNWDTAKFADGSSVPDSTYYKIRIIATDTGGVSGSNLSDDWFTIWNTPIVEISSAPYSQTTTESVNATYYLTVVNKQPSTDTFDLFVDNTDNITVAELSQDSITLDAWESGTVTLNITDGTSGTYRVTARAASQTEDNITGEATITTYVRDAFTLAISAPRTQTSIGGVLTPTVEIANNQGTFDTFTLTVTGVDESWFSLVDSCQLTAGETEVYPLEISIPNTASAGKYILTLQATSSNLGTTKEALVALNVSTSPVIFDLAPTNDTHTGATEVIFTWTSSVDSTTELFIKAQGKADYTLVSGDAGIYHAVSAANLSRNAWYDFYVCSNSTHGSATSEVRRIFIDNGIIFSRRNYVFTIERDYNQERTITIINTDDEPHEVLLNVSGVPEDLALNFVGEGSMDQAIALLPGESKDIAIVFHAQDAEEEEHTILFNLTNLGDEEIIDFAYLKLHVHFPVINFTIEEIDSDPHTLAKTIRITNYGDSLTDLTVSASDELSSILMFQPSINHIYLGTGRSVTFDAIPGLSEGFTGASGTINASADGEERSLAVNFTVPEGKQVFIGRMPIMTINFDEEFDSDDIPNTNPSGDFIDSYIVKSGEQSSVTFIAQIKVRVEQNGEPAYAAKVVLNLNGCGITKSFYSTTDLWGNTIFTVYGPTGEFSYAVSVVGYDTTTGARHFTVNKTPSKIIEPLSISWQSVSDANTTFDLTGSAMEKITLDTSPFVFQATKTRIGPDATPILYLRHSANYSHTEVIGEIDEETIVFNFGYVDPGNYTVAIAIQSSDKIATSSSRKVVFTGNADITKQRNYTYEWPFPIDAETMAKISVDTIAIESDPHKIVMLLYVTPNEDNSKYVFTYMIMSDKAMADTLRVVAKDHEGTILYEDTQSFDVDKFDPLYIDVPIPVYYDGISIETFNIKITTDDPTETICNGEVWKDKNGVWHSHGTWWYFWHNGMLTPHNKVGVAAKCFAGFVPGVNTIIGWVDLVNNIGSGEGVAAIGGGSGLALDPLLDLHEGKDTLRLVLKDKLPLAVWKELRGKLLGKSMKEQVKIFKDEYLKAFKEGKKLTKAATAIGLLANVYSNYDDWKRVIKEQEEMTKKAGLKETHDSPVRNCINHAPLKNKFGTSSDLDYLCSPIQNVEGIFVTLYFPREVPASYQPFDTIVMLNGHEVGRISDTVPQGYYTFEADPSWLNYADVGVAENTITLDVEGMNRGYYVPLEGYKIDILFKKLARSVCAASQAEADQIAANLSTVIAHKADFTICSADIRFSHPQPSEGEAITIEATIHNLGSFGMCGIQVQFIDNGETIDSGGIPYLPAFGSQTVYTTWTATGGTHNIKLKVNPEREINESDYTNNEATKTITVTAPDTTPPEMSNPQPRDNSTVTNSMPLISADLADPDSGINTTAVRITVDDLDVTQNATVISSRAWYTPEHALADSMHNLSVYAEDNKGNNNTLCWSFTVATEKQPPVASSTYSPLNPTVNETILFNATKSYDPDGFIVNYEWKFGDDIAATGEIVEHSYSKPGDYTLILRVTDNDNVSNTNTMILTITTTTSVETAVCGDVTGDNKVTMGDARRIEMWLLYPEDYPIHNLWAADVTGDGAVTGDDARRIIMWLSDPEQYPLACRTP
jgi:subtilase family serine protease/uncharacterized membrane protein